MPVLSRFLGMVVLMYYNDHDPPHFHVRYGEHQALLGIRDLRLLAGSLPPRALGLVIEWAFRYREELWANWERARRGEPLVPIPPLE
jgi:hypothetical protein